MNKKLEVVAGTDELGEPEEFTWDLFPVVDPKKTLHLDTNGLPKVGTRIVPGMIVVGKIGKTRDTPSERFFSGFAPPGPTTLEMYGLPFEELHARYGHMWKDSSLYADCQTTGIVKEAYLEDCCGKKRAVVVLEVNNASTPMVSAGQEEPSVA